MSLMRPEAVIYRAIGSRVRAERERIGRSQAEIAKALGLSRASVTNIESGRQRFPIHYVYRLADALECDLGALLPDRDENPIEMALRGVQQSDRREAVAQLVPFAIAGSHRASTSA